MSRRPAIAVTAVVALLALAGGGVYVYFFSGLRTSPTTLGLSSPSPQVSSSAAPTGSSSKVSMQIAGNLSVHGVTRAVMATAQAQLNGDKLEVAGTVKADMSDFGVSPPQVPFVTVDSQVTVEFDVFLARAS